MNLRISGIHMDIGEAFRTRIEGRIGETINKYFDGGFSGRVTVEKDSYRYSADCFIHLDSGIELQTEGQGQEPQAAFDAAADRFEKRLRRYKRRLKSHNAGPANGPALEVSYRAMMPADEEPEDEVAEEPAAAIVAEPAASLKTMSVATAVAVLDTKDSPVFVFRNAGNNEVNIVYRRSDGNVGWIDPASISQQ
jgi:ribosomal subunit interface protein